MKNSGVEWIGEIPDDWEITRSKNIFTQRSSKGNSVEEQLAATQQHGMYPQRLLEGVVQVKEDTDLQQFKTVHKNDYVISLRSFQGGFEMSDYEGVCSPAYQVFYNTIPISYRYYKYLFKSDGFISKMNSLTVGIREGKNIQYKDFSNSPIIIPPKSTQQHIASYLDKKCSKIEETIQNQQQVIEKLKAYKQSLITEAVTGKIKIQNGKVCGKYESYKDSKLKWLGDFKIPEVWNTIQVKSFVSIPVVDGPHESPELFDNGIPYISATAIENSKIDFSLKRGFISEKYCDECDKRYKPMRDDILMIKLGATTGQVAIVETDERFNIWVPLAAIRCNKNIALPKFIFYSFQSDYCLKQMEMSWTFGTQQTLGVSSIERLKIFLPNIETQKSITHFLDKKCTAIDTAIEQKQNLIEKLTEYKKSLIYECVTGKKEI